MTPTTDELSSHRTRTNRRPDAADTAAVGTAVLDGPEAQLEPQH